MLLALADTHGRDDPRLTAHLQQRLPTAECVIHAGDFTTAAVLDAFADRSDRLVAVHGNSDASAVSARLPAVATVDVLDRRFLVVHGHDHDRTALSLLARQEEADVVVVGHTHTPGTDQLGEVTVIDPGSHADPRGSRPGYAAIERADGALSVRLRTPSGETIETVRV